MKHSRNFILVLFFLTLFSISGYWILRGKPEAEVSIIEGRVLGLPESGYPTLKIALDYIKHGETQKALNLVWNLYTEKSLQIKFDGAVRDQFPLRMELINFSKGVERGIIKLTYLFLDDEAIPADMDSDIYILSEEGALIASPGSFTNENIENINTHFKNFQNVISKFPEIKIDIFYIDTLPYSDIHPLNKFFPDADRGQGFSYFKSNLPEQISLAQLSIHSIDDHLQSFFRTDHHWNTNGIIAAYHKIFELISTNFDEIPPQMVKSEVVTFPGIEFLGSYARKTLYPLKGDAFIGFTANFPTCIVKDQGVIGSFDNRDLYLRGDYPTDSYLDHYAAFFGSQKGLLEYICDTETDRNILIVGDSYARPLVALIAAHYSHTYFIDPRQHSNFSLTDFVEEHTIDDLLFIVNYQMIFTDTELWLIRP